LAAEGRGERADNWEGRGSEKGAGKRKGDGRERVGTKSWKEGDLSQIMSSRRCQPCSQ